MLKMVAAVRRRPGMAHAEYADYVREVHGGLSIAKKLTLRKYVQNHVFDSVYGATGDFEYQVMLPRDSVTELYFDDLDSITEALADPYNHEVIMPDALNFADLGSQLGMLVEPSRSVEPSVAPGAVKVLHFLKAAEGLTPEAFDERRKQAHDDVLSDASGPAKLLRGHEWNTAFVGHSIAASFGNPTQPAYEGYSAVWFDEDETEALSGFRAYEQALAEHADKNGAFYQPSLSFFLLTKEVVIFDDLDADSTE